MTRKLLLAFVLCACAPAKLDPKQAPAGELAVSTVEADERCVRVTAAQAQAIFDAQPSISPQLQEQLAHHHAQSQAIGLAIRDLHSRKEQMSSAEFQAAEAAISARASQVMQQWQRMRVS